MFLGAGLTDVWVFAETLAFTDYEMANRVFTLEQIARHAAMAGAVSYEQSSGWLDSLHEAGQRGSFFAAATGFCVSGEKL
jgi:hypothetical protein